MEIEITTIVDRPVAVVWGFVAVHHVENHPRWDPDVQLDATSDAPIGRGTIIARRTTRYDTPTEGTMEVVEFEPERVMAVRTRDGPIETNGRVTLSAQGANRTQIAMWAEFPGMDESMAQTIAPLMERSAATIKRLIESET